MKKYFLLIFSVPILSFDTPAEEYNCLFMTEYSGKQIFLQLNLKKENDVFKTKEYNGEQTGDFYSLKESETSHFLHRKGIGYPENFELLIIDKKNAEFRHYLMNLDDGFSGSILWREGDCDRNY